MQECIEDILVSGHIRHAAADVYLYIELNHCYEGFRLGKKKQWLIDGQNQHFSRSETNERKFEYSVEIRKGERTNSHIHV